MRARIRTVSAVTAPQPAGREPAPAPLDLLQDFVNTEIPEWAQDDIDSPAALSRWLVARDLIEPAAPVPADAFVRARALRGILRGSRSTTRPASVRRLPIGPSRCSRSVPSGSCWSSTVHGAPTLVPSGEGVDRALTTLVSIAVEATRDGTWSRLKACRKESCGWVFYDHSRNRSSSWCSMTICGNRIKTAGYRRRMSPA